MATKVIEKKQRFSELYPDPELRYRMLYGFTHAFLPRYVHRDPWAFFVALYHYNSSDGPVDPVHFIQSRWRMMEILMELAELDLDSRQEMVYTSISDLYMWVMAINNSPVAFIEMPNPERTEQANYMAIALLAQGTDPAAWSRQARARYYVLERSSDGCEGRMGRIGEMDEHCRYIQHDVNVDGTLEVFNEYFCRTIEKGK